MVFQNDILAGASGTAAGYTIDQSIRFNDDDSAYMSWTPASAGNRQTWTWSGWAKRGNLGSWQIFFSAWDGISGNDTTRLDLAFEAANTISITGGVTVFRNSTQVFRDSSAWYHIVVVADTTNATAQNRLRIYVNGVEITNWGTNNTVTQNTSLAINNNASHVIGARGNSPAQYFDGYMAEINFIDGQALDPTSFGEYDSVTGVWVPKAYAGSYGTNGFYITGENSSSLGTDYSGNGNNFTSSGLTTADQVTDTPTDNYATWNPLGKNASTVLADGNLFINAVSNSYGAPSTFAVTEGQDKVYVEFTKNAGTAGYPYFGVWNPNTRTFPLGTDVPGFTAGKLDTGLATNQGYIYNNNGFTGPHASLTFSNGDVGMMAVERSTGKIWWGKNGTWGDVGSGTGDPAAGTNPSTTVTVDIDWFIGCSTYNNASLNVNFGQVGFAYTPPTGFSALSTANLPEPTIKDGSAYFNTVLYTGDGSAATRSITGVGFQPDFVWKKIRSGADHHWLHDVVRGPTKGLNSNRTDSEYTSNRLTSFDSDGFSFATSDPDTNGSGSTYVAWNWLAGNGTVSNSDGTITSTVSVNTTAGFSVVGYTGNGSAGATVGHGLGVAPDLLVVKNRDNTEQWIVYHRYNGGTKYLLLNSTAAAATSSGAWNNTDPSSSVVTLGGGGFGTNISSNNMIMYAFAEVEGFSKFGSYVGNGSTNGTFAWCGFRPAWIMIKRADSTGAWTIFDNQREGYNVDNDELVANTTAAETTTDYIDILSNGFKLRSTDTDVNASGGTYVFAAFAENPFKYSLAR